MDGRSFPVGKPDPDVTDLLLRVREGDRGAWRELIPLVYDGLRRIAHRHLRRESGPRRLETTGLVHEAYLKMADQTRVRWRDRAHFYAAAAGCMRRILINEAHRRKAAKRGGDRRPVTLEGLQLGERPFERVEELIALDRALHELASKDERQARIVECRFFGGLTIDETATALDISEATVKRDWRSARAWLYRRIAE